MQTIIWLWKKTEFFSPLLLAAKKDHIISRSTSISRPKIATIWYRYGLKMDKGRGQNISITKLLTCPVPMDFNSLTIDFQFALIIHTSN